MQRVVLARAWRISPAALRSCTRQEISAMWTVLELEREAHDG